MFIEVDVCPCKECTTDTGRSPTCHPNCDKYLKWKRRLDEVNAEKRRQMEEKRSMYNHGRYRRRYHK